MTGPNPHLRPQLDAWLSMTKPSFALLIANVDKLRSKLKDFDRVREKVVGRIITIEPDADAALDAFLDQIGSSDATDYLRRERETILRVFAATQLPNLRLLRQAVFEFIRFWPRISKDIRNHAERLRVLLGTFLTLQVAFHGGTLDRAGLGQNEAGEQSDRRRYPWKAEKTDRPSRIGALRNAMHHLAETVDLEGRVISAKLARAFIGDGYADGELVQRGLAHRFVAAARDRYDQNGGMRRKLEEDLPVRIDLARRICAEAEIRTRHIRSVQLRELAIGLPHATGNPTALPS